ncbi:outer membrane lipoprotein carrier protein LolA [Streptomyces coelicoflavus]|uniref:Outer membrane lipoprotein carrier protein LolA n=1 Tax=Streptomyces coelicoflavus TaxID=285562 RepID=A0A7K3PWN8_9ACTN|nr:outer membrane lipoprotein carrier protein LolA [Streptomyces coelicoflavus]NEB14396.1 outer membrane lipoprotein carrier protein LolA [Streptomyces coelicoflavus]
MAPIDSDDNRTAGEGEEPRAGRRKAARYVVPVAVMGVAAATIGLVPALADSGDPDLPKVTAEQLIEKIAKSDVQQLSGTVRINTDLGLPDLGGLESGLMSGMSGGPGSGGDGEGSAADPSAKLTALVSGSHTLRVAADGPDRQKLSLMENAAEYSLIHNGKDVWGYDSQSNEVYHSTAPDSAERPEKDVPATPKDFADEALKSVDDTTSVTVGGTAQVAGRDAYRLVVEPKQDGSTVGAITVAVDAETGTPLKFTLTPASGGAAVVDVGFTKVSFAKPDASTFDFTPPAGAKVTEADEADEAAKAPEHGREAEGDLAKEMDGLKVIGEGWNAIATFDTGARGGLPTGAEGGDLGDLGGLGGFLGSFGDQVKGDFGSGTVFKTRLVNALITDDGKVYAGAVTKDALVKAADAAK